jgi:hypothetical protein
MRVRDESSLAVLCALRAAGRANHCCIRHGRWYNSRMTLLEISYELQSPLSHEQLRRLGEFANTYGLRRFRVDEKHNRLTIEYDASRLRETQVAHVLGLAGIPVVHRLEAAETVDPLPVEKASLPR